MNELEQPTQQPQTRDEHMSLSLFSTKNFKHYMGVSEFLSKSSMVPKGLQNKPADIMVAMEMALQVGIPMMQGLQDIAVINGKPCMYGDGLLAIAQGHQDFEWIKEEVVNDVAVCIMKRKGNEPHKVEFSKADATKAGLWGKSGPWSQYPMRMLQMRARGFCLRDMFSDALRGIKAREEVQDYSAKPAPATKESLMDKIKQAKGVVVEAETGELAGDKSLEDIEFLIAVKDFDANRTKKAMAHYNVDELTKLTQVQADSFINELKKLEDV